MVTFYSLYHKIFVAYSKRFSRQNLYLFMEDAIKKYNIGDKKTIFNIGAGGEVSRCLKMNGIKFTEIDSDPGRKPDAVMDMQHLSIADGSVDCIFCMFVLEHIKNPFKAVHEAGRVLKKGGIIVGSVPHALPIHDAPHDYWRFTRYGVANLFEGFRSLKISESNTYLEAIYVLLLRLFVTGSRKEKAISVLLFPLYVLVYPLIVLGNIFIKNKTLTTAYYFVGEK